MNENILLAFGLLWIVFATLQDLKSREVANWLNFSLIFFVLGFRFFVSLFENNFLFFYEGLIGLGIFFVLGNLFYYGKMFAGGDSKLFISLGVIIPYSLIFSENLESIFYFLALFFIVAFFYSLFVTIYYAGKNFKRFKDKFVEVFFESKRIIYAGLFGGLGLILLSFLEFLFLFIGVVLLFLPFLYLFAKSVDEAAMIKRTSTSKLMEGDWLYRRVRIGKKTVNPGWNGLTKKDIRLLKKRKYVYIRQGIPFTPVFLISFILWCLFVVL